MGRVCVTANAMVTAGLGGGTRTPRKTLSDFEHVILRDDERDEGVPREAVSLELPHIDIQFT